MLNFFWEKCCGESTGSGEGPNTGFLQPNPNSRDRPETPIFKENFNVN